jgi:hypothetical protein
MQPRVSDFIHLQAWGRVDPAGTGLGSYWHLGGVSEPYCVFSSERANTACLSQGTRACPTHASSWWLNV